MAKFLNGSEDIRGVKVDTGWGWLSNLTSKGMEVTLKRKGGAPSNLYKEKDIVLVLEIQRGKKSLTEIAIGGLIGNAIGGQAGMVAGAYAAATNASMPGVFAIRMSDGYEAVFEEKNYNNLKALRRMVASTGRAALSL